MLVFHGAPASRSLLTPPFLVPSDGVEDDAQEGSIQGRKTDVAFK